MTWGAGTFLRPAFFEVPDQPILDVKDLASSTKIASPSPLCGAKPTKSRCPAIAAAKGLALVTGAYHRRRHTFGNPNHP